MTRRVLDLSTLSWQFAPVPRQPWAALPVNDLGQAGEWLPARVPGDVRADLMAAGKIASLDSPAGIAASAWVDEWDWWYRVEVPGGNPASEQIILQADGIDFYSAIWLDDSLLATHAGMFAPLSVALSPHVNRPGPHTLAIRLWGGRIFGESGPSPVRHLLQGIASRLRPDGNYFSARVNTTKAQFSFGWDFSPRLLSTGIWDDLRMITARGVYIEDLRVDAEPLTGTDDPTPARWRLRLRLHRWQSGPMRVEISLYPDNFSEAGYHSLVRTIELCADFSPPCTEEYEFQLETAAARRWWPWDQGDACLYQVRVCLCDEGGLLDEATCTAGVRSVAREGLPDRQMHAGSVPMRLAPATTTARSERDRPPWQFLINGRPVFFRGANWVPADVLPGRLTAIDYERLLAMARSAGINFLRVWGGGIREKRAFWDLCDRLGIMAWQEFPLACDFLDSYSRDQAYLALLEAEAGGIVDALYNHPSLIAWCGGNEISLTRERLQLRQISEVLKQKDTSRPWIPASPGPGDVHQWDVWHGLAPWTELADQREPFISEFGLQALPSVETLSEMFPAGRPASLADPRFGERKAHIGKLLHYGGPAARGSLREAVEITQRVQAVALQVGLEAARLRRPSYGLPPDGAQGPTCGGVAFWQFNEPWPAVSWSVIDRAGRPKAAYEMLLGSYQPVLVAAVFAWRTYRAGEDFEADLWLVNDGLDACENCCMVVELDGEVVWRMDRVTIYPASVKRLGQLTFRLTRSPLALSLRLTEGDVPVTHNRYDLAAPLPPPRPLHARLARGITKRFLS